MPFVYGPNAPTRSLWRDVYKRQVEGVSRIALLADALLISEGEQRHLAMLIPGKRHAHHTVRLECDHTGELFCMVDGKMFELLHGFRSFHGTRLFIV